MSFIRDDEGLQIISLFSRQCFMWGGNTPHIKHKAKMNTPMTRKLLFLSSIILTPLQDSFLNTFHREYHLVEGYI